MSAGGGWKAMPMTSPANLLEMRILYPDLLNLNLADVEKDVGLLTSLLHSSDAS